MHSSVTCRQQPAALVQSPDALLDCVIEQVQHERQYTSVLSCWGKSLHDAEAAAVTSATGSTQVQQAVVAAQQRVTEGKSSMVMQAKTLQDVALLSAGLATHSSTDRDVAMSGETCTASNSMSSNGCLSFLIPPHLQQA